MKQHDTYIIIPALNEEASIASILGAIRESYDMPVVLVNDKSDDATCTLAREHGATVLDLSCRLGAWGATQAGFRYALSKGCKRVVTMDADGQHPVGEVEKLLAEQERTGADLVIGSCTGRGSRARRIAWSFFRFLTGLTIKDLTSGFRVYSADALELLSRPHATQVDYQDVAVLLLLKEHGLQVIEKDVDMCLRDSGKSRIFSSWLIVAEYMLVTSLISISKWGKKDDSQCEA